MPESRVNLGKAAPELYRSIVSLDQQAAKFAAAAGLAEGFAHLLRLRASQLNQCAYCVRAHTRDALASGESADRIALVAAWQESRYFTDKERAAMSLMESVTLISQGQVPEAVYQSAATILTPAEIAAVEWLGVVINAWNRIAVSSRYPVQP